MKKRTKIVVNFEINGDSKMQLQQNLVHCILRVNNTWQQDIVLPSKQYNDNTITKSCNIGTKQLPIICTPDIQLCKVLASDQGLTPIQASF
jgi:hypothetical protein